MVRLADGEVGQPRYQLKVHVRNDEPAQGWLQVATDDFGAQGEPIRVPGKSSVEIGRVVDAPPNQFWLFPFLSLNGGELRLKVHDVDPQRALGGPFAGSRPSDWLPPKIDGVVVDDLDPGFSTDNGNADPTGWSLTEVFGGWSPAIDRGLPVSERWRGEWIRRSVPLSWGKYRHTIAQAMSGGGDQRVFFTTELPAGRWLLEYHLPEGRIPPGYPGERERTVLAALGSMDIRLVAGRLAHTEGPGVLPADPSVEGLPVEFDAAVAEAGWNKLGEFDLPGGQTRLVVTNRTSGVVVVADAIRWRRLE